jgi:hypothetical protein
MKLDLEETEAKFDLVLAVVTLWMNIETRN